MQSQMGDQTQDTDKTPSLDSNVGINMDEIA
jgi:hypothetical protein